MITAFTTKLGVSLGDADQPTHVAVVREPQTGETLRTKGRLYVLVEVEGRDASTRAAAQEAAESLREEYYYDRSAGIEVALRRALLQAGRQARRRLRGGDALHLACLVLCRNEAYTVRVGAAEVFLVRRARLFVPGDSPGTLTDYAFRLGAAAPQPLRADHDVLPSVWREQVQTGDTVILAGSGTLEVLGAETLKNAAVTLHPGAAAQQLHDRFVAEAGTRAREAVLIVELGQLVAQRRTRGDLAIAVETDAERIAERLRGHLDALWQRRPRLGRVLAAASGAVVRPLAFVIAVVVELLPRRVPPLPRAAEMAAARTKQRRRVSALLALGVLVASSGVLLLAYGDYQEARARGVLAIALANAEQEVSAARAAAEKKPPDVSTARTRLEGAERFVAQAAAAPRPDTGRIVTLRAQIAELRSKLTPVVSDLARSDPRSSPVGLDYTPHGIYVADPGAGKLWKLLMDGTVTAFAQKGQDEMGVPRLVATSVESVYVLDDANRLFRTDAARRTEITVRERQFKEPVAMSVFGGNLYVLDRAVGQVWKYEPTADGNYSGPPVAFLATPLGPNAVRSLGVDGDVWVVTDDGQLARFHRSGGSLTASRVEFAVRWSGEALRATHVLAKEANRSLYLLDPAARRLVQVGRDGREQARIALPTELPEPIGEAVFEDFFVVATLHGTRLARTDLAR